MKLQITQKTIVRFWKKIRVCEHGKTCRKCCWIWTGDHSDNGYGRYILKALKDGKSRAHRISWIILKNNRYTIPEGWLILHTCDVNACVNPFHLFLGDHQTNMSDKQKKGRAAIKLTTENVIELRMLFATKGWSQEKLAKKYEVSTWCIRDALKRKYHTHVKDDHQPAINDRIKKRKTKIAYLTMTDRAIHKKFGSLP
jgi:DNA-binding XRE family transcriptional regulator